MMPVVQLNQAAMAKRHESLAKRLETYIACLTEMLIKGFLEGIEVNLLQDQIAIFENEANTNWKLAEEYKLGIYED
jgi:hypothetical protein